MKILPLPYQCERPVSDGVGISRHRKEWIPIRFLGISTVAKMLSVKEPLI